MTSHLRQGFGGQADDLEPRLRGAENEIIRTNGRITTHEKECALRYRELRIWIAGAILAGLIGGPAVERILGLIL